MGGDAVFQAIDDTVRHLGVLLVASETLTT